MAKEVITLPKSGKILTWTEGWRGFQATILDEWEACIGQNENNENWLAWLGDTDSVDFEGTREECIAWLDDRIMKLRAALLAPDAFVVEYSPKFIEASERAVAAAERSISLDCVCGDNGAGPCAVCKNRDNIIAKAFLEALRKVKHD